MDGNGLSEKYLETLFISSLSLFPESCNFIFPSILTTLASERNRADLAKVFDLKREHSCGEGGINAME
jgi:hypothetical protein